MEFLGDYHLHTKASDGHGTVSDYISHAEKLGLEEIAITDHSFCSWTCHMTMDKFAEQEKEIANSNTGVKVYHGVEANIIAEDGTLDVPDDVIRQSTILLAGFHRFLKLINVISARRFVLVNGYLSEREKNKLYGINTRAFAGMLEKYPIDIITHIGHRTPMDFVEIAKLAKERDVYIELNEKHILSTRGLDEVFDKICDTGVNFIVGTDAHRANKLANFSNVEQFVRKHNIPRERIFGAFGNRPVFKDRSGWRK